MNSVWYGSSDTCQMASPESFEVWATLRTKIQAEKGSPHPKIEKNKCVLNWFLGKIQCFKANVGFSRAKILTANLPPSISSLN